MAVVGEWGGRVTFLPGMTTCELLNLLAALTGLTNREYEARKDVCREEGVVRRA